LWKDRARFKYLSANDEIQGDIVTSFGAAVGRLLIKATQKDVDPGAMQAQDIREAILAGGAYVDLQGLLSFCWAVGVPVIHLRVFPLQKKSMHAMVIEDGGRHAILLGKDANYPAPVAFTLAHELGHIGLGHLGGAAALVDLKDPATSHNKDEDEKDADEYALTLLTGRADPRIQTEIDDFNAPTLAAAARLAAPQYGIDPGTLALCLAYQTGKWPVAMSALKFIYEQPSPAWSMVNGIADSYLKWDELTVEACDFLHNVMTDAHA
jgi:Zn-dependent peptidase ImmA (M78 family)